MTGEKFWFILAGLGFCVVIAVLYVKRHWYARVTVEFMFFYKDQSFRDAKVEEFEPMFKIMLGYVFPAFMALWLVTLALS